MDLNLTHISAPFTSLTLFTFLTTTKSPPSYDTLSAIGYMIFPLCPKNYEHLLVQNIILDSFDYESLLPYLSKNV